MNISEAYGIPADNYADFADFSEYPEFSSEFADADESYGDDFDEARRPLRGRRMMKPITPKPAKSAYQPKPNQNAVTQAQLQAALAKVSQQINAGAAAVKAVDARVRSTAAETERTGIALRKEIADRKKEVLAVRKDLQSTREMAAIMPLLGTLGGGSMAAFAPILMLGQDVSGSTEGGTASSGGLFSGPMGLITIMALSGGLGGGGK